MSERRHPLKSLKEGRWFKLICGASYQNLPAIRNLALAYTLAGADCVDVAADVAVVAAVQDAFSNTAHLREKLGYPAGSYIPSRPLLMVSFSDGEDPHFRKASFNPSDCPSHCPRPCEQVCPADAIAFSQTRENGVIEERCYGCGRCLPVCPIQHIQTYQYRASAAEVLPQLINSIDAIEIHTQVGHESEFRQLWQEVSPWLSALKLLAISCPSAAGATNYLWKLYRYIAPLPLPLIWQTDGRPMSGDIGAGTTQATIRFADTMLQQGPPGYVQLAGGTNAHTLAKLSQLTQLSPLRNRPSVELTDSASKLCKLPEPPKFGGIAYGSYARHLLQPVLAKLDALYLEGTKPQQSAPAAAQAEPFSQSGVEHLESNQQLLRQALRAAHDLVSPLKQCGLPTEIPVECPRQDAISRGSC